ncbi:MAG TPA: hypothetical protein VE621_21050 [Bryobacteraceae bacterium]|nr:hypothetical protein [Bryobacteraceae bacterium]
MLPAKPVAAYITSQRDRLLQDAVALPAHLSLDLAPYFESEVLNVARLHTSETLPIPELPFVRALARLGLEVPNSATIEAITFDNLIAARNPPSLRILFHELVHVVQYRVLGIDQFARQYVAGFLSCGSYDRIPLESCARLLEERFSFDPTVFSVADAVQEWLERERI